MTKHIDPVEVYAQGFLDTFGNDCGLRLQEVAGTIGISITEVDAESFDGALIRIIGKARGKIAINANIREAGRKRFTLAHELGHYILPGHAHQSTACRPRDIERWTSSMPTIELEANRFAAALLMPKMLVLQELRAQPSLEQARSIGQKCQTSLTAASSRLVELSTYPIAMVWSASGRRSWYKASNEFGRAVELGPVSPYSFAHDCFAGTPVPSLAEPVPAAAWLYVENLNEDARIWEESVRMPSYDAVLSLLYLREPVDNREHEEDGLEELNPAEFTLSRKRWPTK